MGRLSIDQFRSFFVWYKGLPHQDLAIAELWKLMPVSLLEDDADWIQTWRDPAIEEDPEVPVVLAGKETENSWGGVVAAAKKAGAKYPEVVAAQWAVLESGWFDSRNSGDFNYLGREGWLLASPVLNCARLGKRLRWEGGNDPG